MIASNGDDLVIMIYSFTFILQANSNMNSIYSAIDSKKDTILDNNFLRFHSVITYSTYESNFGRDEVILNVSLTHDFLNV